MRADLKDLQIIKTIQLKDFKVVYICKCRTENCYNETTIRPTNRHGGYCRQCSDSKRRKRPYEALYNSFKGHYIRKHKQDIQMTYEEFAILASIKECHYCQAPTIRSMHRDQDWSTGYMLDRKDNNLAYTYDNCVSCCWPCNDLKSDRFTYEQFVELRKFMKNELGL